MKLFILSISIISIIAGCMMNTNSQESKLSNLSAPTSGIYFEMPIAEVEAFRKNIKQIKIGDTVETVIDILGQPTYDQVLAGKEANALVQGRKFKYYLRRYERDLVNEKQDRLVSILFNLNNRITRITSNCDGILNRP